MRDLDSVVKTLTAIDTDFIENRSLAIDALEMAIASAEYSGRGDVHKRRISEEYHMEHSIRLNEYMARRRFLESGTFQNPPTTTTLS